MAKIDSLMFKPTVGGTYKVKVIKMIDFGAVVEYLDAPGNETLLHVSELAWERTENVSDVVNMGDVFDVKYLVSIQKHAKKKYPVRPRWTNQKGMLPDRQEMTAEVEDVTVVAVLVIAVIIVDATTDAMIVEMIELPEKTELLEKIKKKIKFYSIYILKALMKIKAFLFFIANADNLSFNSQS